MTFNELVNAALLIATDKREAASSGDEARDLSLSITHLEDAMTRYNSSRYRNQRTWKRADPDAA